MLRVSFVFLFSSLPLLPSTSYAGVPLWAWASLSMSLAYAIILIFIIQKRWDGEEMNG